MSLYRPAYVTVVVVIIIILLSMFLHLKLSITLFLCLFKCVSLINLHIRINLLTKSMQSNKSTKWQHFYEIFHFEIEIEKRKKNWLMNWKHVRTLHTSIEYKQFLRIFRCAFWLHVSCSTSCCDNSNSVATSNVDWTVHINWQQGTERHSSIHMENIRFYESSCWT